MSKLLRECGREAVSVTKKISSLISSARRANARSLRRSRTGRQECSRRVARFLFSSERTEDDDALGLALFGKHAVRKLRRVSIEQRQRVIGASCFELGVCTAQQRGFCIYRRRTGGR